MTAEYDPDHIRERLRAVRLGRVYRLIHRSHRSRPLDAVATPSRFSDPAGRYSILYTTDAVVCGFGKPSLAIGSHGAGAAKFRAWMLSPDLS